jgi:hypothetical protein
MAYEALHRVSGDRRGDAVGFSTLRKAAMQRTPTSRKSGSNAPYRPIHFCSDDGRACAAADKLLCWRDNEPPRLRIF